MAQLKWCIVAQIAFVWLSPLCVLNAFSNRLAVNMHDDDRCDDDTGDDEIVMKKKSAAGLGKVLKLFFFKSSFVKVPSSWYLPERLAPWDGSGLYRERDWCNLCNARCICIIFALDPANCDKSVWTLVKNASTPPEVKIDARTKWTKNGILFLFLHQSEVNGEDLSPVHIGQESETLKYHEVSVRFWDLVVFFLQFILCNLLGFIWLVCDSLAVCCFGSQRIDTKKSVPDA